MKKKLILDVDTGIDDAIGIILAVKSRQYQYVTKDMYPKGVFPCMAVYIM